MKTLKQFLEAKGITLEAFNAKEAEDKAAIFNELNEENAEAYKALQTEVEEGRKDKSEKGLVLRDFECCFVFSMNWLSDITKSHDMFSLSSSRDTSNLDVSASILGITSSIFSP